MSEPVDTGLKRPGCGGINSAGMLRDSLGGMVNLQIVGTDPDTAQPIDGSALTEDYAPDRDYTSPDGTFLIAIETDNGVYEVTLADGTMYTITAVQSHAYLGTFFPAKLIAVRVGTTGSFSVGH